MRRSYAMAALCRPLPHRGRARLLAPLLATAVLMISDVAKADFRLCNNTTGRVGIAVGYKENDGWTTEGWWNLPARTCETVLRGTLQSRVPMLQTAPPAAGRPPMPPPPRSRN
jgi:uncharacterized membrane protein